MLTLNKTCTQMFTAALFVIVKKWTQSKRPSTDKWIKKTWYTHVINCYLAIDKNEVFIQATWINLKNIMLSKRS